MKGKIFKVLRFERLKIFCDKKTLKYALFIVLGLFAVAVLMFCVQRPIRDFRKNDRFDRAAILNGYRDYLEQKEVSLDDPDVVSGNLGVYSEEIQKYIIFIKTDTTSYDYFDSRNPENKAESYEINGFVFMIGNWLFWLSIPLGIAAAALIFSLDYTRGMYKNLVSTSVSRNGIFSGKIIAGAIVDTGILLFIGIILFALLPFNSAKTLILYDGIVTVKTSYELIAVKLLSALTISLFVYTFSVIVAIGTRKLAPTLVFPVLLFGVLYVICGMVTIQLLQWGTISMDALDQLKYYPIIGLHQASVFGFIGDFFMLALFHLAASALFGLIARKIFMTQEL